MPDKQPLLTIQTAVQLWDMLYSESKLVKPIDLIGINYPQNQPSADIRIFDGYIKATAAKLGLKPLQATQVAKHLYDVGAMTRLSASNRILPGIIQLNFRPTITQIEKVHQKQIRDTPRVHPSRTNVILQQQTDQKAKIINLTDEIKQLRQIVDGLRIAVEDIRSVVAELDARYNSGGSKEMS